MEQSFGIGLFKKLVAAKLSSKNRSDWQKKCLAAISWSQIGVAGDYSTKFPFDCQPIGKDAAEQSIVLIQNFSTTDAWMKK